MKKIHVFRNEIDFKRVGLNIDHFLGGTILRFLLVTASRAASSELLKGQKKKNPVCSIYSSLSSSIRSKVSSQSRTCR
jgi:hypothetical protein